MKNLILSIVTIILILNCNAQVDSLYFGQTPPGDTPIKFAPNIITGFKHSAIAISLNGNEIFWTETEKMTPVERRERIKYSEYRNGEWSNPIYANFVNDYLSNHNGSTVFSLDGTKLFFNSDRPGGLGNSDVYFVEKNENGWDSVINVGEPYNTTDYDISPVFTDSGKAYRIGYTNTPASFSYSNGTFSNIESIDNQSVSEWYSSAYISPEEDYIIYAGDDTPNLFIRFKSNENEWGDPINMGNKINTGEDERFPIVSPDGKYLFFIRGEGALNNYYWVSTAIIDSLKNSITGIKISKANEKMIVFPNPTNGLFTMSNGTTPVNEAYVEIYNLQGSLIHSGSFHYQEEITLDLTAYPVGLYLVRVLTDNGYYNCKIVIK